MENSQITPGSYFQTILSHHTPGASAWVRGGEQYPEISGFVYFYHTPYAGILIEAELFNLPGIYNPGSSSFFAMHIHENGDCSDQFSKVGGHYAVPGTLHPNHKGDLLPLLANQGYAWSSFYDNRFTIDEIIGRSVIIHANPDDFHTQPSGNSGEMIACGVIQIH